MQLTKLEAMTRALKVCHALMEGTARGIMYEDGVGDAIDARIGTVNITVRYDKACLKHHFLAKTFVCDVWGDADSFHFALTID